MKKQSGIVLIVSLIMLFLLSLIGVTSLQSTTLEEKMAGNAQDRNVAFQAAESTLLELEKALLNNYDAVQNILIFTDPNTGSILSSYTLLPANQAVDFFAHSTWSTTSTDSGPTPPGFGNNFGISSDPRYVIKRLSTVGAVTTFEITARAVGKSPGTQVILQEVFERTN